MFMVKEELRRVTFSLNFPQGFYPDEKEQAEVDELAHVRNGLFYGKTEVMDGELKIVMFVVEDEETGKIHYVGRTSRTFKDRQNSEACHKTSCKVRRIDKHKL